MKKHVTITGILLALLVLLWLVVIFGAVAFGQDVPVGSVPDPVPRQGGLDWSTIVTLAATGVGTAVASGVAALGANRMNRQAVVESAKEGAKVLPDGVPELLGRLDERTEAMVNNHGMMAKRVEVIAKRQHKQGQVLLVTLLRQGGPGQLTPAEALALQALADESEEDDPDTSLPNKAEPKDPPQGGNGG